MLHDTVVIEGEVSLISQIDGDPDVVIAEGGGIVPSGTIEIASNGAYNVTDYASANVTVPNSYSASDEGKVVSSSTLVAQTSQTITENGTYNTTLKNEMIVNIPMYNIENATLSVTDETLYVA